MDRKEYMRAYYLANREKILSSSKANFLANREERLTQMREYSQSSNGAAKKQAYAKVRVAVTDAWRKRNPEKWKAHAALYYAVRSGKIVKSKVCDICDREIRTEAHHPDYSKPLEVMWLCRRCHIGEHTR
jgi:hypothetical protein